MPLFRQSLQPQVFLLFPTLNLHFHRQAQSRFFWKHFRLRLLQPGSGVFSKHRVAQKAIRSKQQFFRRMVSQQSPEFLPQQEKHRVLENQQLADVTADPEKNQLYFQQSLDQWPLLFQNHPVYQTLVFPEYQNAVPRC